MQVTLLFYPAKQPTATWLDRLVAWIDGGQFSHVEIVERIEANLVYTVGCHAGRGGVSRGIYNDIRERFELVTVDAYNPSIQAIIKGTMGAPYNYLGALRTVLPWLPEPTKGWCCSTWAADVLFLESAATFGVEKLYQWAKQHEIKNEI